MVKPFFYAKAEGLNEISDGEKYLQCKEEAQREVELVKAMHTI